MRTRLLLTVLLWGSSLVLGAGALLLANIGAPAGVWIALLLWLGTLGLPTTAAVVGLASVWHGWPLGWFAASAAVIALGLNYLAVLGAQRRWRSRSRRYRAAAAAPGSISRRSFLTGALVCAAAPVEGSATGQGRRALVDFHVHLFGVGDAGSGCFLSERQKRHVNYRFFLHLLDLEENGRMDEDYVHRLVAQLRASTVDRAVLLAQDMRYDRDGRPDPATTNVYVPNDWLFEVVARHPDLFVPCASVNPKRRDALEELVRCRERGARVVKIHPPTQDVDPGHPRFRPFWRRTAELGLILMVHTGTEHASAVVGQDVADPARLEPALQEGCVVIAAHSGTGSFFDRDDFFPGLVRLVQRYPNLYRDLANLAAIFRWRNLPRILRTPDVLARAVYASDFPFPPNPLVFWNRVGPLDLVALLSERNVFERDLRLKQALGFPAEVFDRGARLLG